MRVTVLMLAAIFFLAPQTTDADDTRWLILGIGNQRCGAFLDYRQEMTELQKRTLDLTVFSWASGFFSGMNLFTEAEIKDLSNDAIGKEALTARLTENCYEDRDATLVQVLATIYGQLP